MPFNFSSFSISCKATISRVLYIICVVINFEGINNIILEGWLLAVRISKDSNIVAVINAVSFLK